MTLKGQIQTAAHQGWEEDSKTREETAPHLTHPQARLKAWAYPAPY